MKKLLVVVLAAVMSLSLVACGPKEAPQTEDKEPVATMNDGTYIGESRGMKPMKVEVVVSEGKIASVEVIENGETPNLSTRALTEIPAQIVELQGLGVDVITGSTVSSGAVDRKSVV